LRIKIPANLGFLASGRGSNMQAIIDACKDGQLPAKPVVVISNNRESGALKIASKENIPSYLLSKNYDTPEELDALIIKILIDNHVDLVILAGYMKKLGKQIIETFPNRIINIHPSLLPEHGGKGMYGLNVHQAVIDAGEKVTGATVHLVNDERSSFLISYFFNDVLQLQQFDYLYLPGTVRRIILQ
jgi:phosphoribosylglycinamide formyltransferase-1